MPPPLEPEIQERAEGSVHQVSGAGDEQHKHQAHFQHSSHLRFPDTPGGIPDNGRCTHEAHQEQRGIASQVVQGFRADQGHPCQAEHARHIAHSLGKTVRIEQHEVYAGQSITVDSICPNMSLYSDEGIELSFEYHKSWGMQTEYDRFWDAYQNYGSRSDYRYAFYGPAWTNASFKPKYQIAGNISYAFNGSGIKVIDVPVVSSANAITNLFQWSNAIETVSSLDISKATTGGTTAFTNAPALKNITFVGEIPISVSFAHSNLLTAASVQNIIDHLKDLTGATAQTLTLHATVGGNLTDAQKAAITAKNWTLVY